MNLAGVEKVNKDQLMACVDGKGLQEEVTQVEGSRKYEELFLRGRMESESCCRPAPRRSWSESQKAQPPTCFAARATLTRPNAHGDYSCCYCAATAATVLIGLDLDSRSPLFPISPAISNLNFPLDQPSSPRLLSMIELGPTVGSNKNGDVAAWNNGRTIKQVAVRCRVFGRVAW